MRNPTLHDATEEPSVAVITAPGAPSCGSAERTSESSGRRRIPSGSLVTQAKDALVCAGRVLEANRRYDQDLSLAATLLAEALEAAALALALASASAFSPVETTGEVGKAIEALDDTVLKASIGSRKRAIALVRAISPSKALSIDDLRQAELFAAKLVAHASRGPAVRRTELRIILILVVFAAVVIGGIASAAIAWLSNDELRFHASSEAAGFPRTGYVNIRGDYNLFFHTKEEDHPWVEIELGDPRKVEQVTIENRSNCCTDRAVPMVIELRDAAGTYREVARRNENFDTWTAKFPVTLASAVRLGVPRTTTLHLSNVQIR